MITPDDEDQQVNSWTVASAMTFGGVYLVTAIFGGAFGSSWLLTMDPIFAIIVLPMATMSLVCSIVGLLTGVTIRDTWLLIFTIGPLLPLAYLCFVIYSLFIRPLII
jgi:hypothetical protein